MALVDNAFYVNFGNGTSTGYYGVTQWSANSGTFVTGNIIRQLLTPTVGNERTFVCVSSTSGIGTTGGTEPTWGVTRGAITNDNTLKWQEATGVAALNGDVNNTPTWNTIKGTAITLGQVIQSNAGNFILICTIAGTAGSTNQPGWFYTTAGGTFGDGTVQWTSIGIVGTTFANWAAPHARLANAFAANWGQAGNSFFVASEHAETQSTTITITSPGTLASPCNVYCVAKTPVPATSVTTGAIITASGTGAITFGNHATVWDGLSFQCAGSISINAAPYNYFRNCVSSLTTAGGGGFRTTFTGRFIEYYNCTFTFANIGQGLASVPASRTRIVGGSIAATGTVPTTLMLSTPGVFILEGVDLSAFGSGTTLVQGQSTQSLTFIKDCKLGTSVTVAGTPTEQEQKVFVIRSDSSGTNYVEQTYEYTGTQVDEITIVRTGGASDGATAISKKITTTANSKWVLPFELSPRAIWNTNISSTVTASIAGIVNAATVPNNDQIWLEVEFLGTTGFPLGVFANNTKANNLATGTPLPADTTSVWGAQTSNARLNSHTYSVGNVINVSTAPNLLFFCTGSGSTAGALPGTYAVANDGTSVTDGAATFRAGYRFLLTVVLSSPNPQYPGYIYATVKAAQATSTWWIDPLIQLS